MAALKAPTVLEEGKFLTPTELDAIRLRLHRVKIQGPWTVLLSRAAAFFRGVVANGLNKNIVYTGESEADFMCHARDDVAALLAHAKRLEKTMIRSSTLIARHLLKSGLDRKTVMTFFVDALGDEFPLPPQDGGCLP